MATLARRLMKFSKCLRYGLILGFVVTAVYFIKRHNEYELTDSEEYQFFPLENSEVKHSSNSVTGTEGNKSKNNPKNGTFFYHQIGPNNIAVHESGYWSGTDAARYHAQNHAKQLGNRLVIFFTRERAKSVLDLGGGAGQQVENLVRNGIFATCYDGNPDAQVVSNGVCGTVDLTKPLHFAKYDWVMSLSVGRQIPRWLEPSFVSNFHRLNRKGIIMYWGDGRPDKSKIKTIRNNTEVIDRFLGLGCYTNDKEAQIYLRGTSPNDQVKPYSVVVFRKLPNCTTDGIFDEDVVTGPGNPNDSSGILGVTGPNPVAKAETINLAIVTCGENKLEEALTMIKSAILFSQHTRLRAFIFTDHDAINVVTKHVENIYQEAIQVGYKFEYEIHLVSFPEDIEGMTPWKEMFKPCSLQRIFLPSALPHVDSLIYMDADVVVLSNLTDLWDQLKSMNSTQFIALSKLTESTNYSWFTKNNILHYGGQGLNCGIALMNLTRMRAAGYENLIIDVRKSYEHKRPESTGDQFIQNILYSYHPEFVQLLPCEWNLRRMQCSCALPRNCSCQSALANGVQAIHGTNMAFTDHNRLPLFRHIYEAFKSYTFTMDNIISLRAKLNTEFKMEKNTCFFHSAKVFYQKMDAYMDNLVFREGDLGT